MVSLCGCPVSAALGGAACLDHGDARESTPTHACAHAEAGAPSGSRLDAVHLCGHDQDAALLAAPGDPSALLPAAILTATVVFFRPSPVVRPPSADESPSPPPPSLRIDQLRL